MQGLPENEPVVTVNKPLPQAQATTTGGEGAGGTLNEFELVPGSEDEFYNQTNGNNLNSVTDQEGAESDNLMLLIILCPTAVVVVIVCGVIYCIIKKRRPKKIEKAKVQVHDFVSNLGFDANGDKNSIQFKKQRIGSL